METGSIIKLRPFNHTDGYQIAQWVSDLEYFKFFRNCAFLPTIDECCNYPAWAQNIVMMVEQDDRTIGMVNAYQVNFRNRAAYAGCLIDKKFQGGNTGHNSMTIWISYLFNRFGFRKILVEHVDEFLTPGYFDSGFTLVGRRKAHCDVFGVPMDEIELEVFREDWKEILRDNKSNFEEKKVS